jgi:peptide/nickel transport system substrate-binding protein
MVLTTAFLYPGLSQQVSAQMPPREKSLIIAHGSRFADPENWNILLPTAVSRSASGMHQLIYEYFFYINMQTGELIPWLATGYNYSPDYTVLTVYLRKGVTWSDGKPFTADDVVFTYNLLLQHGAKLVWGDIVQQYVESVTKIDDYTVQFKLKNPNPRFHLIREAFPTVRVWR